MFYVIKKFSLRNNINVVTIKFKHSYLVVDDGYFVLYKINHQSIVLFEYDRFL